MENPPDTENSYLNNPEIREVIEDLSLALLDGDVTDDNPSPSNGLTSLEQIIVFELAEHIKNGVPLKIIKAEITLREWYIQNEDIEEDESKCNGLQVKKVFDTSSLENPYTKEILWKIAKYYISNVITDDNTSPSSDYDSIDQIINYKFFDYYFGDEELGKIKDQIEIYITILEGGSNLSDYTTSYFNEKSLKTNFL